MICFTILLRLEYYGFCWQHLMATRSPVLKGKENLPREHNEYNQHSLSGRTRAYKC